FKEPPDVSDEEGEKQLVQAARLQMAKQRQQQLSTMVLMGINRIVVTDGLINAKVMIDIKTKDTTASSFDNTHAEAAQSSSGGGWFSGDSSQSSSSTHDVTVSSAASDTA